MSFITVALRGVLPPARIVRVLTLSNFAKTAAHGVLTSVSVLYFTSRVGIPDDELGLALSAVGHRDA